MMGKRSRKGWRERPAAPAGVGFEAARRMAAAFLRELAAGDHAGRLRRLEDASRSLVALPQGTPEEQAAALAQVYADAGQAWCDSAAQLFRAINTARRAEKQGGA